MAKTVNNESYKHVRINPETGERDYYFPMEINYPELRTWAKEQGFDIARTRLGFRTFDAVMVPCKDFIIVDGKEMYISTPEEKQHRRYLDLIADEMNAQEKMKEDGRCTISDGHGGVKRCPLRIPNPNHTPNNGEPKTLPVKCENCPFEQFKQAHTTVEMSCLDHEDENGEIEFYEPATPENHFAGEQYTRLVDQFIEFVTSKDPQLAELAKLKTAGYSRLESAEILGLARSTAGDHVQKLKKLATEFLDNAIIF